MPSLIKLNFKYPKKRMKKIVVMKIFNHSKNILHVIKLNNHNLQVTRNLLFSINQCLKQVRIKVLNLANSIKVNKYLMIKF